MTALRRYVSSYIGETAALASPIDQDALVRAVQILDATRKRGGRLFCLGVGGRAANASHAAGDFRKMAGLEAYAPTDNAAELTAWTNDEGWDGVFVNWLRESRLSANDTLLVLSVGGGSARVSHNLSLATGMARKKKAAIVAIASRDGGRARKLADAFIHVPVVNQKRITPHAEGWQSVLLHLIVNALCR